MSHKCSTLGYRPAFWSSGAYKACFFCHGRCQDLLKKTCQAYFPIFLRVVFLHQHLFWTFPILPLVKSSPTLKPPQLFTIASPVTCITVCLQLVPSNTSYLSLFSFLENILSLSRPRIFMCSQSPDILHTVLVLSSHDGNEMCGIGLYPVKMLPPFHFPECFFVCLFFSTPSQIPGVQRMSFCGLLANCPYLRFL